MTTPDELAKHAIQAADFDIKRLEEHIADAVRTAIRETRREYESPTKCSCSPEERIVHRSVHLALAVPKGARFEAGWMGIDFVRAFPCSAVIIKGDYCSNCGLEVG